jgi:predicted PurR-regulated permease PerM
VDLVSKESGSAAWQQAVLTLSRVVTGVVIVLALSWGRAVLMPIALAILLTFLLNPIVRRIQTVGLGRVVSVILAVSFAGMILTVVGVTGSQQVSSMLATLPENTTKIIAKMRSIKALSAGPTAQSFEQMIEAISRELQVSPGQTIVAKKSDEPADALNTEAQNEVRQIVVASEPVDWHMLTGPLGSAMEGIAMLAFAGVLLVFFLLDREGLRDRIVLLAGKTRLTVTSKALEDATNRVSRYIGMVALVNGGFGLLMAAGLFFLGVPYAVLWGCLGALLRFVPYLGPWIAAVFPIVMSLAMSDGWGQPISAFAFLMVLELVTNNVVEPLTFGHTTGVSPTALLISAAFWLFLWGPLGLILSAPFAVTLVVIGKNIPQLRFLYVLLADQPALSDDDGFYQRLLLGDRHQAALLLTSRLRESDPEHVFDQLVMPALMCAKRDQKNGQLDDDEADALQSLMGELLAAVDLSTTRVVAANAAEHEEPVTRQRLCLLGYAVDGDIDRVALKMLQKLLDPDRWDIEVIADGTLTSEVVAGVAVDPPAAICITSIPPGGIAHARYLCKKLRTVAPDVPLLVGRWGQRRIGQADRVRLIEAGANYLATSLVETRKWLDARYPVLCQAPAASNRGSEQSLEPTLMP